MILACDVGGTKTGLALYRREGGALARVRGATFRSADPPGFEAILRDFLRGEAGVERACVGAAGPVSDGRCRLTNIDWTVDEASIRGWSGAREAYLINDLQAMASSLPFLPPAGLAILQEGVPAARGNAAVLAAGTGLGEGFLVASGDGYVPLASEGGHVDFAPRSGREEKLLAWMREKYGRVSVERVLSGPGLRDIHRFLRETERLPEGPEVAAAAEGPDPSRAIVAGGLSGESVACAETLRLFCSVFGAVAGNLALQYLAAGGVYLGGGIAPALLPALREGPFLAAFRAKGRMAGLLARIPVAVILDPDAPLLGAAEYAAGGGVLRPRYNTGSIPP